MGTQCSENGRVRSHPCPPPEGGSRTPSRTSKLTGILVQHYALMVEKSCLLSGNVSIPSKISFIDQINEIIYSQFIFLPFKIMIWKLLQEPQTSSFKGKTHRWKSSDRLALFSSWAFVFNLYVTETLVFRCNWHMSLLEQTGAFQQYENLSFYRRFLTSVKLELHQSFQKSVVQVNFGSRQPTCVTSGADKCNGTRSNQWTTH